MRIVGILRNRQILVLIKFLLVDNIYFELYIVLYSLQNVHNSLVKGVGIFMYIIIKVAPLFL